MLGVSWDQFDGISLIVNIVIFAIVLAGSIVFLWKVNLGGKGFKLLFALYTLFWIPLMLLRENTGVTEKAISSDTWMLIITLGAYGAIGIIVRPLADVMGWGMKSRKSFIYFALAVQFATYLPMIIYPCDASSIIQSIGVGVGASCIGTYQLLFSEQYGKAKTFLSVSVLSIPPLLADFISSPITNIFGALSKVGETSTGAAIYDPNMLKWMWLIGLVFVVVCVVLAMILKEDSNKIFGNITSKIQIKGSKLWIYFVLLLVLASLVGFVKFAGTGTAGMAHIAVLDRIAYGSEAYAYAYRGYLSVIFSLAQLIGGLITGLVLVKYLNKLAIVGIGCGIWAIYSISSMFAINPYGYLAVHFLNGLAYGILYNLLLAFALNLVFTTKWVTPMGIYQAVLSIGIMFATSFSGYLRDTMQGATGEDYQKEVLFIIFGIMTVMIVIIFLIYLAMWFLERSYRKDHPEAFKHAERVKEEHNFKHETKKVNKQAEINKFVLNSQVYNCNLFSAC